MISMITKGVSIINITKFKFILKQKWRRIILYSVGILLIFILIISFVLSMRIPAFEDSLIENYYHKNSVQFIMESQETTNNGNTTHIYNNTYDTRDNSLRI